MPELSFSVLRCEPLLYASAPVIGFRLRIVSSPATQPIHAVSLRCQIQIEAPRRHYEERDHARLVELFGEPSRWGQTVKSLLWTHVSVPVPAFQGGCEVELPVPCTYDFNLAAAKYFFGLEAGEVPLVLLFSGTIFYPAKDGELQVSQVPWSKEASFRFPVRAWHEMMAHYYPNRVPLTVRKDIFQRVDDYKVRHGLATWELALEQLLGSAEGTV